MILFEFTIYFISYWGGVHVHASFLSGVLMSILPMYIQGYKSDYIKKCNANCVLNWTDGFFAECGSNAQCVSDKVDSQLAGYVKQNNIASSSVAYANSGIQIASPRPSTVFASGTQGCVDNAFLRYGPIPIPTILDISVYAVLASSKCESFQIFAISELGTLYLLFYYDQHVIDGNFTYTNNGIKINNYVKQRSVVNGAYSYTYDLTTFTNCFVNGKCKDGSTRCDIAIFRSVVAYSTTGSYRSSSNFYIRRLRIE